MLTAYAAIGSILLLLAISAILHGWQWRLAAMFKHLAVELGRLADRAGQPPRS